MNTAFVTYFDILGFKEIVDHRSEEEIINILNRFRNLNTSSYNGAEALIHSFKGEYKFTNFSDCIVRSLSFGKKLSIEDKLFFLELEISEIADIQYRLLVEKGVLLRGGLSYGEIHHSEEYIFGKALNKSYGFESKYSVYPRVIIDNDIIDDIVEYSNTGHYFPCGKSVNGLELSKILKQERHLIQAQKIGRRVKYGVKEELLLLVELKGIGRVRARKLINAGIRRPSEVKTN
ncbi:MAG: hypothetical protein WCX13_06905, partial [Candidatus Hydrogenedentales bacterium]